MTKKKATKTKPRVNKPKRIVLHCADTRVMVHDDVSVIRKWHVLRGFKDIGYHIYIRYNGTVQKGRDESVIGAHALKFNTDSIGICLFGRNEFQNDQFRTLAKECRRLMEKYDIPIDMIVGHGDLTGKLLADGVTLCPGFDVDWFKKHFLNGQGNGIVIDRPHKSGKGK